MAVKEDKPIGYCYAHQLGSRGAFCHSVELSIYLDHKVRALGIGAKLYEVMEPLLKQQGILNLYACIATPVDKPDEYLTDASLHFHHKQGFTIIKVPNQCGYKFERFYDLTRQKIHWPSTITKPLIAPSQVYYSKSSKPAIDQQTQHLKPLTKKSIKQAHKLTKEPSCT